MSMSAGMDTTTAQFPQPSSHCKILHLIRHAQGIHNIEGQKDRNALLCPKLFDAQISPLGFQQIHNLREHVRESGLAKKVELVITSPLSRAMQTALGVFGGEGHPKVADVPPLTQADAGNIGHCTTSASNFLPVVAVELCRECLGVHPCDKRRNVSEYRSLFPAIDFSLIENDDDNLWKADIREAYEDVAARGMKFMKWLWTRPEKEIAIVSHGIFLQQTLIALVNDCDPSVKSELCKRFDNCEMRTVVIAHRSEIGSYSDSLSVNCGGKISVKHGNRRPSEAEKENVPANCSHDLP